MRQNRFFVLVTVISLVFLLLPVNYLYGGENENIKGWINQLSDRRERATAKNMLIKAKEAATAELINVLEDEHAKSSVKVDIIQIFEINKTAEAIPVLKELTNSPKRRLRLASIKALGAMENKDLADIFKKAIKDSYGEARLEAMSALMKLKDKSAVSNFIEALPDRYASIRMKALDALALFKDKSAIPALIKRLNDTNTSIVLKTIDILSNFKDKIVVEALIKRLDTGNKPIKIRTIEALAKIKDKSALPYLEPLLNDEYIGVRRAAKDAVNAING
ncbi:MAG: HEAT repeat domain-containing protein [Candidatus Omnitrophota bacterium]|nr:MAG: HEAT repeat domain-containing protein [Candidatus Omnitrophota bacterium]